MSTLDHSEWLADLAQKNDAVAFFVKPVWKAPVLVGTWVLVAMEIVMALIIFIRGGDHVSVPVWIGVGVSQLALLLFLRLIVTTHEDIRLSLLYRDVPEKWDPKSPLARSLKGAAMMTQIALLWALSNSILLQQIGTLANRR